ncbi:MSCRAMM family protein [Halolamina sp. C58]|uniref:MSCRAMM family protein n=1 Tax=Halolamina sp. C58 TaxID=3421640 RepID=UPI003EBD13E5
MLGNNSTIKIGGVLAVVALVMLSAPVSAASMIFLDTGTEFQNNAGDTVGSINYPSTGLELTEGSTEAYYETTSVSLSSSVSNYNLDYNVSSLNTSSATIGVYDASDGTLINEKTLSASGSGQISFSSSASNVYLRVSVPSGSSGATTVVDSLDLVENPPTGSIEVTDVTDQDGASLSSFDVTIEDSNGNVVDETTGASAPYTASDLETGTYMLFVTSDGYANSTVEVSVTENSTTSKTISVTEQVGTVEVSEVTNSNGTAINSFDVTIEDSNGNVVDEATGVSAPYSVSGLDSTEDYNVTVNATDYDPITKTHSFGAGGSDSQAYTLSNSTGSVSVTVNDPSGSALSDATVEVVDSSGSVVQSVTSDSSGVASLSNIAVGDYTLDVHHPDYTDVTGTTVSVSDSTTTNKTIAVKESGAVEVTVNGPDGNALDSATVELVDADGNVVNSIMSNSNGIASFSNLNAGDYNLNVKHTDYQPTDSVSITVNSGETATETVQIEDYRSFDFSVEDADGNAVSNATVEIKQDGSVVNSATTGDDGTVTVGQIADGTYTIAVNGIDYKSVSKSVEIKADAQISADLVSSDSSESSSMTVDQETDGSGGGSGSVGGGLIPVIVVFSSMLTIVGFFLAIKE